ncbi:SMP-30/gluconolactonase/LRE family protein [Luminiphilus sp.]|nr:SMP-30/gluconolactonase/LRE family protein [Luminiphilus sp.]MDA8659471.1 SMP-30/gluconolactonase/LRE family protein [Luminiphilus sp.]MDB2377146.1 SMP-30/gluconolactonase/LRE family protein [Luminiphilus sp.]MDC3405359.1 SMP-30/gluconolactonase/LRE family protein [Luminiphilus sp.]
MKRNSTRVCDGFAFIEGPRWHHDALWFSDMHDEAVFRVVPGGIPERVVAIPQRPSGLGWLPSGDLLIASMLDRKILRHTGSGDLMTHADVSAVAERRINDMLVDALGRAWVGNFGFDLAEGEPVGPGTLARVDLDGTVHAAAADLLFANGMALLAGGETLVVAETFRGCLTAFDIASNSDLINRRVWAQCPEGAVPDGICADAEGAIWAASPTTGSVLRLGEGGSILDVIETGRQAIACALGGPEGNTLFVSSAVATERQACREARTARIDAYLVSVPAPQ